MGLWSMFTTPANRDEEEMTSTITTRKSVVYATANRTGTGAVAVVQVETHTASLNL